MYGNNTYGNTGYGIEQGSGQGKVIGGPIRLDLLMSLTKIKAKVKPSGQHLSYNLLESRFMKSPYFFNLKETALRYLSQTGELKIGSVTLTPPVISLSGEEVKKINVKYKTRPDKTELTFLPLAVNLQSEYRVTTSLMGINSEVSEVSSVYDQKVKPSVIYSGTLVYDAMVNHKIPLSSIQLSGEVGEAEIFKPEYRISWEQGGPGFIENDLIIAQRSDYDAEGVLKELYKIKARVKNVPVEGMADLEIVNDDGTAYRDFENNSDGIEFIRIGNTEDTERQGLVMITSDTTHAPYIDVKGDIDSFNKYEFGLPKVRLGNLAGIDDPDFGILSGYGLYSDNVYLKGFLHITGGPTYEELRSKLGEVEFDQRINQFKNTLGDMAYKETVLEALEEQTIIAGGFIKTSMIDVEDLFSTNITASGSITGVKIISKEGPNRIEFEGEYINFFYDGIREGAIKLSYSGTGLTPPGIGIEGGLHIPDGVSTSLITLYGNLDVAWNGAIQFNHGAKMTSVNWAGNYGGVNVAGIFVADDMVAKNNMTVQNTIYANEFEYPGGNKVSEMFLRKQEGWTGTHNGFTVVNGQITGIV